VIVPALTDASITIPCAGRTLHRLMSSSASSVLRS
jgi:hypothetical protein